jgi:hypothetical protein
MVPATAGDVSNYQSSGVGLFVPIDNITGFYAVQVFAADGFGNLSDPGTSPIRDFWWPGTPGSGGVTARTITAPTTVVGSDDILQTDSTAAGWTQPLPVASARRSLVTFKKISADANTVTISAVGSDLIDGAATYALSAAKDFLTLAPVSGGWSVVAKGTTTTSGSAAYLPIDPRYTGAYGDGTHDDSVPISAAIAAGGLFLQAGIIFGFTWAGISAAIAGLPDGFQIYGGGTLRLLSGSTPALTFAASAVVKLYDFVVDGNGQTGTNPVIYLNAATNIYMRGLLVTGAGSNPNLGLNGTCTYEATGCHGIADQVGLI